MKKTIAIITLYGEYNLGNKLQNYATQTFFSELGFHCNTISYCRRRNVLLQKLLSFFHVHEIFACFGLRPKIPRLQKIRTSRFRDFTKTYINMGPTVSYNNVPSNFHKKYDYFITGSDQVWHNWSGTKSEINYFMLTFAKEAQRLTMSPSFGITYDEIKEEFLPLYKNGLNGFKKLSCREEDGAALIKKLTGREALVTLDPTMLIDVSFWQKMAKTPDAAGNKKYLLLYFLGGMTVETQNYLCIVAEHYKLEIVDLCDKDNISNYITRPDEFLWWIKNAELVATDSFHSTVFSILFRTPFITYSRVEAEGMEGRIDTILKKFGLWERKNIYDITAIGTILNTNFEQVDNTLKFEIKKAKEFYSDIL